MLWRLLRNHAATIRGSNESTGPSSAVHMILFYLFAVFLWTGFVWKSSTTPNIWWLVMLHVIIFSIDMACLRYPTFSDPKSWHNTRGRTPVCHVLRNVWLVTGPSHHHLAKIPLGPLRLWQKMELHMGIGQNYRDEHPFRSNKALAANSCLNLRMYLGFDVWIALNSYFDG